MSQIRERPAWRLAADALGAAWAGQPASSKSATTGGAFKPVRVTLPAHATAPAQMMAARTDVP